MRIKRVLIILISCIAIAGLLVVVHIPSLSHYEKDFGFALDNISVKILDYYHHDDFRDSLTIYRVVVNGETDGSVFDTNIMSDGLSQPAESMLKMAIESTSGKDDFKDLASIDTDNCKSNLLDSVNGSDASLCIINYGTTDQFIVIWVG